MHIDIDTQVNVNSNIISFKGTSSKSRNFTHKKNKTKVIIIYYETIKLKIKPD